MAAEQFVKDMAKRGWEYVDEHGFRMTGPYPSIEVMSLPKPPARLRNKEALARVIQGDRLRDPGGVITMSVPLLTATEYWEYELAGVFVHKTLVMDLPYPHEEKEMLRKR
mgnify:FL=1